MKTKIIKKFIIIAAFMTITTPTFAFYAKVQDLFKEYPVPHGTNPYEITGAQPYWLRPAPNAAYQYIPYAPEDYRYGYFRPLTYRVFPNIYYKPVYTPTTYHCRTYYKNNWYFGKYIRGQGCHFNYNGIGKTTTNFSVIWY